MAGEAADAVMASVVSEPVETLRIDEADRALLRYADTLTKAPMTITGRDVDALREAGFDDRAIHDACAVVAYFAFVNRIADGLGVEMERPGDGSNPAGRP
jgi:uncharacterized peroxidase-related enzyme